jgi:hypothetical protein
MQVRKWTRLLVALTACGMLAGPVAADRASSTQRGWAGAPKGLRQDDRSGRRPPRGSQEPAFARGYGDGYAKGVTDARGHDRYDPVRHKDYRDGDQGYAGTYGSRDAYRNNYRAGFRQGYDEGYRDITR